MMGFWGGAAARKEEAEELRRENKRLRETVGRLEQMVQDREQYVVKTAQELEAYRRQHPPDEEEARRQEKLRRDWEKLLGYTGRQNRSSEGE